MERGIETKRDRETEGESETETNGKKTRESIF